MAKKKPVVMMDANLLCWMAGIVGGSPPKKFDLAKERAAFDELVKLRGEGKIELFISNDHLRKFAEAHRENNNLLEEVGAYYDGKISKKTHITIAETELDGKESELFDLLTTSGETQDDPELFLFTNLSDPSVTHVASCDVPLSSKWDYYENVLKKAEELASYSQFRRRRIQVIVGLPSIILADVQGTLDGRS